MTPKPIYKVVIYKDGRTVSESSDGYFLPEYSGRLVDVRDKILVNSPSNLIILNQITKMAFGSLKRGRK